AVGVPLRGRAQQAARGCEGPRHDRAHPRDRRRALRARTTARPPDAAPPLRGALTRRRRGRKIAGEGDAVLTLRPGARVRLALETADGAAPIAKPSAVVESVGGVRVGFFEGISSVADDSGGLELSAPAPRRNQAMNRRAFVAGSLVPALAPV